MECGIVGQVFEDAADPDFYSIVDADDLVNRVFLSEEGRGEALGDEHVGAIEEGVAAAAGHWEGEHDREIGLDPGTGLGDGSFTGSEDMAEVGPVECDAAEVLSFA